MLKHTSRCANVQTGFRCYNIYQLCKRGQSLFHKIEIYFNSLLLHSKTGVYTLRGWYIDKKTTEMAIQPV